MEKSLKSPLADYICKSILIERSPLLKLRMNKEILKEYEKGLYEESIESIERAIEEISTLGLKYPSSARPIYYIYIVPDDNFRELLDYPPSVTGSGGGKPVECYDLDGFVTAYGVSSNVLEDDANFSLEKHLSEIHEFAHMSQSMFFRKDQFWCEGFVECIVYYALGYETRAKTYIDAISRLSKDDLIPVRKLIELGENDGFHSPRLEPHLSCSFEVPYVSSFLFVRGCLEKIRSEYDLDRKGAVQKFLEIMRLCPYYREYSGFMLADMLGLSRTDLLNGTDMQYEMLNNIKEENKRLEEREKSI